jgi:hypothetical protein
MPKSFIKLATGGNIIKPFSSSLTKRSNELEWLCLSSIMPGADPVGIPVWYSQALLVSVYHIVILFYF